MKVLCDRLRMLYASNNFLTLHAFSNAKELNNFEINWTLISLLLIWESSRRLTFQNSADTVNWKENNYIDILLRKINISTFTWIDIFKFVSEYNSYYKDTNLEMKKK